MGKLGTKHRSSILDVLLGGWCTKSCEKNFIHKFFQYFVTFCANLIALKCKCRYLPGIQSTYLFFSTISNNNQDARTIWYTAKPDFSLCFEKIILGFAPCLFLWISFPFEWSNLRKKKLHNGRYSKHSKIKLVNFLASTYIYNYQLGISRSSLIYRPINF